MNMHLRAPRGLKFNRLAILVGAALPLLAQRRLRHARVFAEALVAERKPGHRRDYLGLDLAARQQVAKPRLDEDAMARSNAACASCRRPSFRRSAPLTPKKWKYLSRRGAKGSIIASAACGPRTLSTATARLRVTTGEGCSCSSVA